MLACVDTSAIVYTSTVGFVVGVSGTGFGTGFVFEVGVGVVLGDVCEAVSDTSGDATYEPPHLLASRNGNRDQAQVQHQER